METQSILIKPWTCSQEHAVLAVGEPRVQLLRLFQQSLLLCLIKAVDLQVRIPIKRPPLHRLVSLLLCFLFHLLCVQTHQGLGTLRILTKRLCLSFEAMTSQDILIQTNSHFIAINLNHSSILHSDTTYIILRHFVWHFQVFLGHLWDTVFPCLVLLLSFKALLLIKNETMMKRRVKDITLLIKIIHTKYRGSLFFCFSQLSEGWRFPTLALRSLSAGVSVQMERSLFSGPDLFLNVRAPKPMCCSSGGSSVIHVSLVSTSGPSC